MSVCHKHSVEYAGKFCPFCSIERRIDDLKQQHEMHEHIIEVDGNILRTSVADTVKVTHLVEFKEFTIECEDLVQDETGRIKGVGYCQNDCRLVTPDDCNACYDEYVKDQT